MMFRPMFLVSLIETYKLAKEEITDAAKAVIEQVSPTEYTYKWLRRKAYEQGCELSDLRITYARNQHGELQHLTYNKPWLWQLYYRTELTQKPELRCMCCNNKFNFNDGVCMGCGNVMLALVPGTTRIGQLVIKEKPVNA